MCFKVTTGVPTCPLGWCGLMPQAHPSCLCSSLLRSPFPRLFTHSCAALLEFNPFCASPHMSCAHNYEPWSLQSCLYSWCWFLLCPAALQYPLVSPHLFIHTHLSTPPSAVRALQGFHAWDCAVNSHSDSVNEFCHNSLTPWKQLKQFNSKLGIITS